MKKLFFLTFLFAFPVFGNDFIDLAKRTNSIVSGHGDIDYNNPLGVEVETTLSNQRVFLFLSARHLNTSFYTLVNSDSVSKNKKTEKITPPKIVVNNLKISVDGSENPTSTCDGVGIGPSDTSCTGKNCNIAQRIISSCNDLDCWSIDPTTDRTLLNGINGVLHLKEKIEITDCIQNNSAGQKHEFVFTVDNISPTVLSGGSIQYSLILQNDISSSTKR